MTEWVSDQVTDKARYWSDSGPMKTKRTALTQFRYETQIIETRNIDLHGFFNLFLLLAAHRDYSYLDQHLFAHFSRVLPFHDNVSQWLMGNGQWAMGSWNQRPRQKCSEDQNQSQGPGLGASAEGSKSLAHQRFDSPLLLWAVRIGQL